jgi:hypothetical protein
MPPVATRTPAGRAASAKRGARILAALVLGATVDEIAEKEDLPPSRVERAIRDELRRRWVAPAEDYARLQIARLETISAKLKAKAEKGDLPTIDRVLRILDRLDRYHGFTRLLAPKARYEPGAREALTKKLNVIVDHTDKVDEP